MCDSAKLFTEHFVGAGFGYLEPLIGHHAGHEIHLDAELRHREIVQDVGRAQQKVNRLVHGQAGNRRVDDDVVLSGGVRRIDAERVVGRHLADVGVAELAVLARVTIAPVPLFADRFDLHRIVGHLDEITPGDEARREHCRHANRRDDGQDDLELVTLGLVVSLVSRLVPEPDETVSREQVDQHEHDAGDPKRDVDREVDQAPVRCEIREVPGVEVINHRTDDQSGEHHCQDYSHKPSPILPWAPNTISCPFSALVYSTTSLPFMST